MNMEKIFVFLWCLIGLVASVYSAGVPSYISTCKRRDPNLSQCIQNSIMALREKLKSGMPELGVPAFEPLTIDDDLTLASSQTFSARTKDMNIYGISQFDDLKVKATIEGQFIELDLHFDEVKLEGDYDVMARILVPITSEGPIRLDAKDVRAKILLKFKIVRHKGREHVIFNSSTCKLSIHDYTSHFTPRPGQDQTFAAAINDVLNSSKQEILSGITGSLERSIAKKVAHIANAVTKNFSYDDLLPDVE